MVKVVIVAEPPRSNFTWLLVPAFITKPEPTPVNAISSLPVPEAPIDLPAVNVTLAAAPVTCILAVAAVRSDPELSMIAPLVAVIVTAEVLALAVTSALAPKLTLRPADRVSVPVAELTVEVMVISPAVDVIDTAPEVVVVITPLIVIEPVEAVKLTALAVVVSDDTMRLPVDAV